MRSSKFQTHGLVCALCAAACLVATSIRAADLAAEIDEIAAKFVDGGRTPGLSITIARGGETLVSKGYGVANRETGDAVTADTVFRIGSVTKQFTGVAIVQLEAAGKLSFDDPITAALPEYPAPAQPVTIRQLLHHTSGVPSFTGLPSYMPNISADVTHDGMIARFASLPLEFDPGSDWKYSNSGYYLLGMVVESASGQSYAAYLTEHLFAPAQLQHTAYEVAATRRAEGYRRNGDTFEVAVPISMTQPFAAGALVSTAPDLVRWQRALVDGRLNPADAFARITSDTVESGGGGERYGYGIGVAERDGRRIISHGGGINGFTSLLAYFPDSDHTIAVLANTEGFNAGGVMTQITRTLFAEE